jgi:D-glycero-D-manno-heptose 1,7-bisphosphate phosphatase
MHHPDGGQGGDPALVVACECRKPKPGMLNALVTRLGADRERSWMIGDSTGDVEAGRAAGLKTALVFATNRCELCPLRTGPAGPGVGVAAGSLPDVHGPNLAEVAKGILLHGP